MSGKTDCFDGMIANVGENGGITSALPEMNSSKEKINDIISIASVATEV